jgi:DNA-binding transcriptional regulator of glucitol operon
MRPKWWLLHVLTIAACGGMVWLGQWQWQQAGRHHGEVRNYAYAVQWWAFTGFTILMWTRVVRDYLRTGTPNEPKPQIESGPKYLAYQPPPRTGVEDDPERLRFNAYLTRLNDPDREDST